MDAKPHILIVDDNVNLCKTLSDILRAKGYVPTSVDSGQEALERIQEEAPVVALIDLVLEDMSGLKLIKEIKTHSPDTECIVLTGYASQASAIEAVNLGAYSYVQKPYDIEQLLVTIRRAIEKWDAKQSLRKSESRYRRLVEGSPDMIYVLSLKRRGIYYSPRVETVLGYPLAYLYEHPLTWHDSIHSDDLPRVDRAIRDFEGGESFELEYRIKDVNGNWHWFYDRSIGKRLENDETVIEALATDITERKRVEEEIRKFKTISDRAGYGVAISDLEGNLLYSNTSFAQMHRYTADELIGKNLCIFHNKEQMKNVNRLIKKLNQEGSFVAEEVGHKRKDGTVFPTLMNGTLIRDEKGQPLFMSATAIDITVRKLAEEELKASREQLRNLSAHLQAVREEERTIIAREIHDELGQTLTALKIDLSWLKKRFAKDQTPLLKKANAMEELIDSTIKVVKRLATELRPALLDDLGLSAAIEWQTEEFQYHTGIQCDILIDPEEIILKEDVSTAVFRIFQETLTNVARHAHANEIHVLLRKTEDELLLEVKDNGKGITKKQISAPNFFGLIGIRERVQFLEGKVTFQGAPNKGTTVTVTIPL